MRKTLLVLALIFGMASLARSQQNQVLSVAGATCTTTGTTCLINTVDPSAGGVTFTVTANASGNTLVFEASGDGGKTWVAFNATPSNSSTAASSTTSTGTWQANIAAYTNVRIRMSTLAGGTSTVSIIFSIASARAGGGGALVNGAGSNPYGALVNVKGTGAGAVGDTRASKNCATTGASTTVTSTDNPWVAADVGKFMEVVAPAQGTDVFTRNRKIAAFVSAGQVTMDATPDGTATPTTGQNCKWFTQDDTAAFQAAVALAKTTQPTFTNEPFLRTPTLAYPSGVYCPPGGYTVHSTIFYDGKGTGGKTTLGMSLIGAPGCVIYPTADFVGVTEAECSGTVTGIVATCLTYGTDVENIDVEGEAINLTSGGLAAGQGMFFFDGCKNCFVKNNTVAELGSANAAYAMYLFSASGTFENNFVQNGAVGDNSAACRIESSSNVLFSNNTCSNHASSSLEIVNSSDRGSGGGQITILNAINDECSGTGGVACTAIQASAVNFIGGAIFGGTPELLSVDATSAVYLTDVNIQAFGAPASNIPGISIANGGFVEAGGTTFASNGTSAILNGSATATFVDTGGNTYLHCISGTCTRIAPADYSHFATGGIVAKSTQTHTPNTCFLSITPIVNATTYTLCNQLEDQNYQVLNITASSQATTTCATAPIVTISDGTQSATLTLTSAKSAWSSAVDTSTGINNQFTSGNTLTVKYDVAAASACATPPTNLAVTFVLQSVLNY